MSVISRNFLCNNFSITVVTAKNQNIIYYTSTLITYISRIKTYLIQEKQVKKNEKIWLNFNKWPNFLVWFIAAAELDLIIVTLDPNATSNELIISEIYNGIEYVVGDTTLNDSYIDYNLFYRYSNNQEADTFRSTPDSILIYTTSTGTTGVPKLIRYTHKFLFSLAIRNRKVYPLLEIDKCLHLYSFIHSSLISIFFLPSIYSCKRHYYFDYSSQHWIDCLQYEKINWCALYQNELRLLQKFVSPQIAHNLNIIAISKLPNNFKETVIKENTTVYSVFGCTETAGPTLISKLISPNQSENIFQPPRDNFYNLYLKDDELVIDYQGKIFHSGDKFYIDTSGNFVYQGRLNLYKINNEVIYIDSLLEFIEKLYQQTVDIIIDLEYQSIYLRSDIDINLQELNTNITNQFGENYRISTVVSSPRSKFITSVKFDANGVRLLCRQKLSVELR